MEPCLLTSHPALPAPSASRPAQEWRHEHQLAPQVLGTQKKVRGRPCTRDFKVQHRTTMAVIRPGGQAI